MDREYYGLFEYDVALSFAAEDRSLAEELGSRLARNHISVFYDEYREDHPAGQDVVNHLVNLYARKAWLCVVLLSKNYPLRTWTEEERSSARDSSFRDPDEYILFLRLDDTEVHGLDQLSGTLDLRRQSVERIVAFLEERLKSGKRRPGPPAQSHDLRSGNVPSSSEGSDPKEA